MFKPLISLAAIAAVLAATLVLPTETEARRCPDVIPETLLSLYKSSDVIVTATFDRIEDGEVEKSEYYTIVKTKSYYSVATTLKGEQQKMLVIENDDYRYAPDETVDETENPEESEGEDYEMEEPMKIEPGDTVLMFLKKGSAEDGEETSEENLGLQPVSYRDGIKKMSGDHLRTYEARINELNVIFNSAGNRDTAIVNWLIDITEDPITRWEGAFELLQAFQELDWAEAEAKRMAESKETDEPDAADSDDPNFPESDSSMDRQRYARLVTDGHKQALLNMLLSTVPESREGEKPAEPSRGDQVLMELVKNWGDARLAGFLLDQLQAGAGDAYYKYQLMETISSSLEDEDLRAIAEEYGDRLYEEDSTVVEAEERVEQGEAETVEPVVEPTEGETAETNETTPDLPNIKSQTYGELRAALTAKFISAASLRLATVAEVNAS